MRMMVLHADGPDGFLLERPLRREIARMQIVRNRLWFYLKDIFEMCDRFPKETVSCKVLKIAYMLTQKSVPAFGKADGVLQGVRP